VQSESELLMLITKKKKFCMWLLYSNLNRPVNLVDLCRKPIDLGLKNHRF